MDFVYKRAQTDNPEDPFFNRTKITKSSDYEDRPQQDKDADERAYAELKRLLPLYADQYPKQINYDRTVFSDEIILAGIVERRKIHRILRGEELHESVRPPQLPRIEDVPLPGVS